ncbi:MAG: N-glycosylase/DNA lyase [Nanoarchaeota archaeon]|nr:N-glycosylase/DNA lyase [Nanoarchaeota archaeon]
MKQLISKINKIKRTEIKNTIKKRLKQFKSFQQRTTKAWFAELCFCLLTANSKALTALQIQKELGIRGFCCATKSKIKNTIIKNKHRFHNNKTKYIIEARKFINIKKVIKKIIKENNESSARQWLAENIKGLGYKEASHFLRNIGYNNLAIVDRHILNILLENNIIKQKPKTITKKLYLEIENKLDKLSKQLKMSQAELDLYLWYLKTGKVLK